MNTNYILKLFFILLAINFIGCSNNADKDSKVKYHQKSFTKSFDSTSSKSESYAHVKVNYVEFTEAGTESVKDSLNRKVMNFINTPVFDLKTTNLEELALALIADYKKLKKEFPESPAVYELERNVDVLNMNAKFVSLKLSEYSFLGGAHPNSVMFYSNVAIKTGKEIKLAEMFSENFKALLDEIGEKQFRIERQLKPEDNLEEAGFWFKDNKFSLNENFALGKDELIFYFNDYEVAPHAVGPTEIRIRYEELKKIIKRGSYLDDYID